MGKIRTILVFPLLFIFIWGCKQTGESVESRSRSTLDEGKSKPNLPTKIIARKDNSPMILIPAGEFTYGISPSRREAVLKELKNAELEIFGDEFPEQIKLLPAYYIDQFEVTNQQYSRFLDETSHRKSRYWSSSLYNQAKQPVVGVGWADAEAYAKWAGKRLPTEEEWEKAARGTDGRIWPWGNDPSGEKYNGKSQGNYKPVAVGSFPSGASPYDLMDMAGNVYEMTTGKWRLGAAMRGGSYLNSGAYARTMFRWATEEEINGAEYLGFRCVMDTAAGSHQ
jgi:formylglycine-generating enzyme required for sulfatase activity